jgi:hypothetical protein
MSRINRQALVNSLLQAGWQSNHPLATGQVYPYHATEGTLIKPYQPEPQQIVFQWAGVEYLRCAEDGFYLHGVKVDRKQEQQAVFTALVEWLEAQGVRRKVEPPSPDTIMDAVRAMSNT